MLRAVELAEIFHMPKVKVLRDSYYGARLNDLGKLIQMRNTPAPLNKSTTRPLSQYEKSSTSQIAVLTQNITDVQSNRKQLFNRPVPEFEHTDIAMVFTDFEWNRSGDIISVGAHYKHQDREFNFYSLVKQRSAGNTPVHNITIEQLKSAPSSLSVFREYMVYLKSLNSDKVVLVAHFGTGADFPKLFRTLHSLGIKLDLDLELADTRYTLKKYLKGGSNTLKLTELYLNRVSKEGYNAHNSLSDSIALRQVLRSIVTDIDHENQRAIYERFLEDVTAKSKEKYHRLICDDPTAVAPDGYMCVKKKRRRASKRIKISDDQVDEVLYEEDDRGFDASQAIHTRTRSATKKRAWNELQEDWKENAEDGHHDYCYKCNIGGDILMCDGCNQSIHLNCVVPPLDEVPSDDWYCDDCTQLDNFTSIDDSDTEFEEQDAYDHESDVCFFI